MNVDLLKKAIEDEQQALAYWQKQKGNKAKEYIKICEIVIEALKKTSDKNCSKCKDKNHCTIHDNFNIDYCSDWSE